MVTSPLLGIVALVRTVKEQVAETAFPMLSPLCISARLITGFENSV